MRHRTLLLLLLLLLLMATTRNAETPPNFVPKTLQNRAQKVPNVPSEILEKKNCLCDDNRLVKHLLFPPAAAAAPAPVTPSVQKAPAGWENTMAVVVVVVVVVRNKSQKYYSLARSPLRLPGSADIDCWLLAGCCCLIP